MASCHDSRLTVMPDHSLSSPRSGDLQRKKLLLKMAVTLFVLSAIVILILPISLPRPVRLGVAGVDLIAAAVVWLLGRQRYGK